MSSNTRYSKEKKIDFTLEIGLFKVAMRELNSLRVRSEKNSQLDFKNQFIDIEITIFTLMFIVHTGSQEFIGHGLETCA